MRDDYSPLVSVTIPFYNAERTLRRALQSVASLHYRPLEVLLIDDASTDSSPSIAADFAKQYCSEEFKIKIYTQSTNSGVAAARAMALQKAEGEYITAVDADDYIDPQAISVYISATQSGIIDIVAAGVYYEWPRKREAKLLSGPQELQLNNITIDSLHFLLTNKLIRTSALRDVRPFTPGQDCWEDLGAISRLLATGASVATLPGAWYHYTQGVKGSLTSADQERVLSHHIAVTLSLQEWLAERDLEAEYEPFLNYLKFIAKVKYLRNRSQLFSHPISRLREWRDTFSEVNELIPTFKKVKPRHRFAFRIAYKLSKLLH